MKKIIIISFLFIFSSSLFGQDTISKDARTFLKNEKKYNKKSIKKVKDILKRTNVNFFIDWYSFKIIPTFKINENILTDDLDKLMLNLKIDKSILMNEIIIYHQPNKDFKSYVGQSLCESKNCKVFIYDDSPERHEKYEKATEKFIFEGNYDLIFKIDNYPNFWFLWKDNQLSVYSFLDETLHTGKNEVQLYFKNYKK